MSQSSFVEILRLEAYRVEAWSLIGTGVIAVRTGYCRRTLLNPVNISGFVYLVKHINVRLYWEAFAKLVRVGLRFCCATSYLWAGLASAIIDFIIVNNNFYLWLL